MTPHFSFTMIEKNFDGSSKEITTTFESGNSEEILLRFCDFINGCGYYDEELFNEKIKEKLCKNGTIKG